MDPINIDALIRGGFVLFVLKELWQSFKGRDKEYEIALKSNTVALVELKTELKYLSLQMHEISDRVKVLEAKD